MKASKISKLVTMHGKYQVLFCILSALLADLAVEVSGQEKDYYWRDYSGKVPEEAIPGGTDDEGNPTYIGHIIYNYDPNHWVPGEINPKLNTMTYVEKGVVEVMRNNFKILCARNPELYQWVAFNSLPKPLMGQTNLVLGGNVRDRPFFIGRKAVVDTKRNVIGRAYLAGDDYIWLVYILKTDSYEFEKVDFEILTVKQMSNQNATQCLPYSINIFV